MGNIKDEEPTVENDFLLTPKQLAFIMHYFENGNPSDAYRASHDVEADARDPWIATEAYQLLNHPRITLMLQYLRERAADSIIYNVVTAMDELEKARALAHKEGQAGAAVSAVKGKMSLLGLDKPKKIDVNGKIQHDGLDALLGEIRGDNGGTD